MIQFLRKIRQSLLADGKTGKYLKYAVGEIVLVVIGILIALGVNKWNQEKENQDYEITILSEISNSLDQEITQLEGQISYLDDLQKSVVKLASYKINPDTAPDSLEIYFKEVQKSGIAVNFNYGPYETLKSSGLDRISNDQVRKSVASLYEQELKAVEFWVNEYVLRKLYTREDLASEIFETRIYIDPNEGVKSEYVINQTVIMTNPGFNKFLELSSGFIPLAKNNMNYASKSMIRVNDLIKDELNKLQ